MVDGVMTNPDPSQPEQQVAIHASPALPPPQKPKAVDWWKYIGPAVGAFIGVGVYQAATDQRVNPAPTKAPVVQQAPPKPASGPEDVAMEGARNLVLDMLASPSTANFHAIKVALAEPPFYLVRVALDSQNLSGALLRQHYCVVLEVRGEKYVWKKMRAVQECPNPPSKEDLDLVKVLNEWGKPTDFSKIPVTTDKL